MNDRVFALLVCDHADPLQDLKQTLEDLSVGTFSARTCEEVRTLIKLTRPQIIFTYTSLCDGSWADIIDLANQSEPPINVVVVSSQKDLKLYLSAMEGGAFDFVLPPFEHDPLEFIVRSAARDVRERAAALARPANA